MLARNLVAVSTMEMVHDPCGYEEGLEVGLGHSGWKDLLVTRKDEAAGTRTVYLGPRPDGHQPGRTQGPHGAGGRQTSTRLPSRVRPTRSAFRDPWCCR